MTTHTVQFTWERRPAVAAAKNLRQVVNRVLDHLHRPPSEVHILVTDDQHIRELNRDYRQIDDATDVLSFEDGSELPDGGILLGQLVISRDTARIQAEKAGHSEMREFEELVIHGVLHLLGYDHHVDEGEMDQLELKIRRDLLA